MQFVQPMDVTNDEHIADLMRVARKSSAASIFCCTRSPSPRSTISSATPIETSRDGFKLAMEISVYSLIAVANAAKDIMAPERHPHLTYFGGEKPCRATT